MEAVITVEPAAGGPVGIPPTQTFTLVLDADRRSAYLGAPDGQGILSFEPKAGQQTVGQPTDGLGAKATFRYGCSNSLGIDQLTFSVDASGRLTGSGTGRVFWAITDIGHMANARLTLTGHADQEPPTLRPATSLENPFIRSDVIASEPLPNDVHPVLVSQNGERTPLGQEAGAAPGPAQWGFAMPRKALRYGETYRITTEGISDFAGNGARTDADFSFTTEAPPPLVPEDGFESATGDTLGGGILFAGAAAPVISGNKSLYLPTGGSSGPTRSYTALALRLALKPGDKVVRFSFRLVNWSLGFFSMTTFGIATPGGMIVSASLPQPPPTSVGMPITIPGQGQLQALPTATAELVLPPDAAGEIAFVRFLTDGTCGGPPLPIPGVIIDDLRAE